jgi:hypothetical protein
VVKDLVRVESLLRDGYADEGWVIVLTNDPAYWRVATRVNQIDTAFRLHEGRELTGVLRWASHAGAGTTKK